MDEVAPLLARVHEVYPSVPLDPTAARLDDSGQNSRVLIIGERHVFRFPRYAEALPRLSSAMRIPRH
jgi:hypothetical protein